MQFAFESIACVRVSVARTTDSMTMQRRIGALRDGLVERDGLAEVFVLGNATVLDAYVRGSEAERIDELRAELEIRNGTVPGMHTDAVQPVDDIDVFVGIEAIDRLLARAARTGTLDATDTPSVESILEAYVRARRSGTLTGPLARVVRSACRVHRRVRSGASPERVVHRERGRLVGELEPTVQAAILEDVHEHAEEVKRREIERARRMLTAADGLSSEQERVLEGLAATLVDCLVTERLACHLERAPAGKVDDDEHPGTSGEPRTQVSGSLAAICELFESEMGDGDGDREFTNDHTSNRIEGES
ncbi:hypothetical protein OB919_08425 [Halobacteria archaeon AArc-curdl1]|uniref:Uncharacterized protein n=1 Tax=Natronosalvus hydrolyticus TaxID=2979988 RepID=A0AAP3E6N3_9EURY|nr:hypothetical protein [Halobacteria archaeon AArc-curdl1]